MNIIKPKNTSVILSDLSKIGIVNNIMDYRKIQLFGYLNSQVNKSESMRKDENNKLRKLRISMWSDE